MNIHLDKLPPRTTKGIVGVDIEGYEMEKEKLHRSTGRFASLQIAIGDDVYIISDLEKVHPALERVAGCRLAFARAQFDIFHLEDWTEKKLPELSPDEGWDVLLVDRMLWGGYYDGFSLADLSRRYLNIFLEKEARELFSDSQRLISEMIEYGARDAWVTARIAQVQLDLLANGEHPACDGFWWLWENVEWPMVYVLLRRKGALVDVERWRQVALKHKQEADRIAQSLKINPASHVQVKRALAELGYVVPNTRRETLEVLDDVELAQQVLTFRYHQKRYSTYGLNWLRFVESDGRVYPDDNIIGAETGRTSSSRPNLQNIPVRDSSVYRECFIAPPGWSLLVADYKQQEPTILAYLSEDDLLLSYIREGRDTHLEVTRTIYHDQTIEHDDPRRRHGKAINLGLSYGLTPQGLVEQTDLSLNEAERLVSEYFRQYSGVYSWIARQRALASSLGYVQTARGRVVWINPYNYQWRNNAINAPVQGSAAGMTKRAMVLLRQLAMERGLEYTMVLNVHDEIVIEVPRGQKRQYRSLMKDAMTQAATDIIPGVEIGVDMYLGPTWAAKS